MLDGFYFPSTCLRQSLTKVQKQALEVDLHVFLLYITSSYAFRPLYTITGNKNTERNIYRH